MVTILLFPGQGAQTVGMGKDLAERFPVARALFNRVDRALPTPLTPLMWGGPESELVQTHNAQPAILAHSAAVFAVVRDRIGKVVAAAGHSLGEYSAWYAADSLSLNDALGLVRRRGELMHQAGEQRAGAMSAVLGLDSAAVAAACAQAGLDADGSVAPANFNAPDQTVISGDPDAVARAAELCRVAGAKRVVPLKVGGAFHSRLMEPAAGGLRAALATVSFEPPAFPVVANATSELIDSPIEAVATLAAQLTAPVRWVESMRLLAAKHPDAQWLELGPGAVLTGLLRRIVPSAHGMALGTAAQIEGWLAA